jgi:hypothetical protein
MGKILLFADYEGNMSEKFNFGKEYEAIEQYPTEDSSGNTQIFVCHRILSRLNFI